MKIHFIGTPTKRWGYEQVFALNIFIELDRSDPEMVELEEYLNTRFKRTPDNKTTFEMTSAMFTYYVTFHDATVYVGTSVRPYRGETLVAPELLRP